MHPERFHPTESAEGLGPSTNVLAHPVAMAATGEWVEPATRTQVPALVIDLPSTFSELLGEADMTNFQGMVSWRKIPRSSLALPL